MVSASLLISASNAGGSQPLRGGSIIATSSLLPFFTHFGSHSSALAAKASFDTTLTYERLDIACNLIRGGATFYSTHPDFVCPMEGNAVLPDSGAICALLTACTGATPKYFGKPERETALMLERTYNVPPAKTAIVGDRLYTDIALGKNNGLLSVLVLTGESTMEDVNEDNAPDVILNNIGEILDYLY